LGERTKEKRTVKDTMTADWGVTKTKEREKGREFVDTFLMRRRKTMNVTAS